MYHTNDTETPHLHRRAKSHQRTAQSECHLPSVLQAFNCIRYISSRDAYMLVYARVENQGSSKSTSKTKANGASSSGSSAPTSIDSPSSDEPPEKAMEVVRFLNAEHVKACDAYSLRFVGCINHRCITAF